MDWEMFGGGVMMLGAALFFWLLNKYGYKGNDDFTRIKRTSNWFGVVIFSIGGLFVIFVSFAPL
jgi:hypothetical protein